jgi:hypothetical protein
MSASIWNPTQFVLSADALAALGTSSGAGIIGFLPFGTGAILRDVDKKLKELRRSVDDFDGAPDGTTDNDAAIALAAAATGGRFHFPGPGTYVCTSASNVWSYSFTAGDDVTLKVDGVDYDVSGGVAGPWRVTVDSPVLSSLRHAVTGNIIAQVQNGASGTATYLYRSLSIRTDSHALQIAPATNGGEVDILFQRSALNADPAGNRFNFTFQEANDRMRFSIATTASGAPSFDTWLEIVAGLAPALTFPVVKPVFNQGIGIKQRAAGGFQVEFVPVSSTEVHLRQVGGSAQTFMIFRDGAMGMFGSTGTSRPTITGSRGGNAALADLLTELATLGWVTDSTTA